MALLTNFVTITCPNFHMWLCLIYSYVCILWNDAFCLNHQDALFHLTNMKRVMPYTINRTVADDWLCREDVNTTYNYFLQKRGQRRSWLLIKPQFLIKEVFCTEPVTDSMLLLRVFLWRCVSIEQRDELTLMFYSYSQTQNKQVFFFFKDARRLITEAQHLILCLCGSCCAKLLRLRAWERKKDGVQTMEILELHVMCLGRRSVGMSSDRRRINHLE